jgi:hypothetical protein
MILSLRVRNKHLCMMIWFVYLFSSFFMVGLIGLFRKEFPCPFYERLPFNILRLIITKGKRHFGFFDKIRTNIRII